jgi:hypothetical protein
VKLNGAAIEQQVVSGLIVAAICGAVLWIWQEMQKSRTG